jgi:hypothetical protein
VRPDVDRETGAARTGRVELGVDRLGASRARQRLGAHVLEVLILALSIDRVDVVERGRATNGATRGAGQNAI